MHLANIIVHSIMIPEHFQLLKNVLDVFSLIRKAGLTFKKETSKVFGHVLTI